MFLLSPCSQRRTKGIDLLEKVCDHNNLVERDYFGLTYRDHEDVRVSMPCHARNALTTTNTIPCRLKQSWINPDKKISKQLKSKLT